MTGHPSRRTRERLGAPVRVATVVVASLGLGVLTSYAQGFVPDAVSSFANSASGWTLLTCALVYWSRLRVPWAALAGAASFVLLVLGYAAASELRGLSYDPTRWSVIGVAAGLVVGTATAWLRERGIRPALGAAVLSGIGVGEAIYGLTVVQETTSPVYWVLIGLLGIGLLVSMLARRIRGRTPTVVAVIGTVAVAATLLVGYQVIGSA